MRCNGNALQRFKVASVGSTNQFVHKYNPNFQSLFSSKVDVSKAKTKIQIRFHDGTRKAQEFNEDRGVRFLLFHLSRLSVDT